MILGILFTETDFPSPHQVTFEAMKRLRDHGLTPDGIAKTPPEELEEILKPVGFYKVILFFF